MCRIALYNCTVFQHKWSPKCGSPALFDPYDAGYPTLNPFYFRQPFPHSPLKLKAIDISNLWACSGALVISILYLSYHTWHLAPLLPQAVYLLLSLTKSNSDVIKTLFLCLAFRNPPFKIPTFVYPYNGMCIFFLTYDGYVELSNVPISNGNPFTLFHSHKHLYVWPVVGHTLSPCRPTNG